MKKIFRTIIIVSVITIAIVVYNVYQKNKNKPEWRVDTVSIGDIKEVVTASGTINPVQLVNIGTEVSGKVAKLYKDYNSIVKKGEILAKLDTENLENQLEVAQTQVQKAQTAVLSAKLDLDNLKALNAKNMASDYELQKAQFTYDQALQGLSTAQFSLKTAEKNLQNAIITSPIDGIIISRNVDEGQTVAASLNAPTLFVIANDLHKMQITAEVDEADIGSIRNNLQATFTVDAYPGDIFFGKVKQIRLNPSNEQNVVSYSVIVDVNNSNLKLLPGMTANVTIIVREKQQVLRIPESALRFKPNKEMWKLFGLKWDDSLYGKKDKRDRRTVSGEPEMIKDSVKTIKREEKKQFFSQNKHSSDEYQKSPSSQSSKGFTTKRGNFEQFFTGGEGRPDFANMTPEQRTEFREKWYQRRKQMEQEKAPSVSTSGGVFAFGNSSLPPKRNRSRVWILENGKPIQIQIVTGLSDGSYTEVIEGLKENQQIITGVNYKNPKHAVNTSAMPFGGGFGPRP